VALDRYLIDLCQAITAASSSPDRAWSLVVDAEPLIISTDVAVPLALVVNELVTNAIQHSNPIGESGNLHILLKRHPETFTISVSDPGSGPAAAQSADGLGTRIVETLARQINAAVAKERLSNGYKVTVTVPLLEAATRSHTAH
jgi:two-component sensor histidine kinase